MCGKVPGGTINYFYYTERPGRSAAGRPLLERGRFNNRPIEGALPRELIVRRDQGAAIRWVGGAMAAIGGDVLARLRATHGAAPGDR
jgi:hypothetical protein